MKKALTIAGFDPSSGAGIQMDLKVFQSLNIYGLSAITALTIQGPSGVKKVYPIEGEILKEQIITIFDEIPPDGVKIGMLAKAENVVILGEILKNKNAIVVLDPIIYSTSKAVLLEKEGVEYLKKYLFPFVYVVTPNLDELKIITNVDDIREAAYIIKDMGVKFVIIKGGHAKSSKIKDILFDGKNFYEIEHKKIENKEFHGTGCVFSSSLLSYLILGDSIYGAFEKAVKFTENAIKKSFFTKIKNIYYFNL